MKIFLEHCRFKYVFYGELIRNIFSISKSAEQINCVTQKKKKKKID